MSIWERRRTAGGIASICRAAAGGELGRRPGAGGGSPKGDAVTAATGRLIAIASSRRFPRRTDVLSAEGRRIREEVYHPPFATQTDCS